MYRVQAYLDDPKNAASLDQLRSANDGDCGDDDLNESFLDLPNEKIAELLEAANSQSLDNAVRRELSAFNDDISGSYFCISYGRSLLPFTTQSKLPANL